MNKLITISLVLAGVMVLGGGCASPYMVDRGRDAKDIFTATVGVGAGAKARVGPFQGGLIINSDKGGLRNGEAFINGGASTSRRETSGEVNLLICGGERSNTSERIKSRNKEFQTLNLIVPIGLVEPDTMQLTPHYFSQVELVCALGPSVRIGFNAGELLDFFLGWFTIDIYNDDGCLTAREEGDAVWDQWKEEHYRKEAERLKVKEMSANEN